MDVDMSCTDVAVTDVRMLMARAGEKGDMWNWTDAGWGGDWLGLKDGKKTAQRIILELKDKVGVVQTWEKSEDRTDASRDAEMALIALGFKQADARKAVDRVLKDNPNAESSEIIRFALRAL